jgi:phage/plasmid-like protein (TIGR03299 family)
MSQLRPREVTTMSAETSQWLNTRTLIGFTEKRGNAWHYRAEHQGAEPNHYPEAVPVEDVVRRLFDFTVDPAPIFVPGDEVGGEIVTYTEVPGKKAWRCSDNGDVLGIFTDGYQGHQYKPWLLDEVANLLDDDLGIGSAGLLRNRGQAWVAVEVPENIETPEGVVFRPHLVAATSFDGSLSTTYKRVVTNVVCDNTLAAALSEKEQQVKVRHSRYSHLRLADAREALAIVHTLADDFAAEVARLCQWEVSERQWTQHLDLTVPVPEDEGRSRTVAINKREQLTRLYKLDHRAAPWQGTAWGVLQAHNTWAHHLQTVRGQDGLVGRGLRNQENAINGTVEQQDRKVLADLALVTAS